MAISLKEQLKQVNQLHEVSYHAPVFDDTYYSKQNHSEGLKNGRKMFYDFYAMEFLWSFLGSGQIPKAEREMLAKLDIDDPRRDIILNKAHRFLPASATKAIDSMYEQVTNAVAENLIGYVERAVVQEFQYLVSQSSAWSSFRQEILSKYNKAKQNNVPFTKAEFDAAVQKYVPKMKDHPEVLKKLLKYSKHFSEMHSMDDKDPFDVSRGFTPSAPKDDGTPPQEFPDVPEEPKAAEEPDDTDYDAKQVRRDFGKYGGPGQPAYPDQPEWSGMSAFKDAGDLPKIPDDDDEEEGEQGVVKEEYINVHKIKAVRDAMEKSGLTLDDIEKGYNLIPWSSSYGGPKWGAGAIALLKLIHAKNKLSTEDMNHIIDHIYDLQHNTGSLLNKGPMYVDDTDLNRRYKITDVSRFIPFVSPVVKNMILRYYRYLTNDPNKAAMEANMENLLRSPKLPFSSEEITQLKTLGFTQMVDNSYRVGIKFKNKQGQSVGGVYYQISKHEAGKFDEKGQFVKSPDGVPMYVVADNLKADVKAFPEFEKAFSYVSSYKNDMQVGASVGDPYTPAATIKSEKQMYIDSHTRIKLTPSKEQELLNLNIGWRKKTNSKYYKGYYPAGHRLLFYAFSDGTFLITHNNTDAFSTYNSWTNALSMLKQYAPSLQEYPDKAEAQADIDAALGTKSATGAVSPSSQTFVAKNYSMPTDEFAQLTKLVTTSLPMDGYEKYSIGNTADGMALVSKKKYHETKPKFAVGKVLDFTPKPYKVVQYGVNGTSQSFTFKTWDESLKFITGIVSVLANADASKSPSASVTPTAYQSPSGATLPPHSPTYSSYKAHVGLATPPKNTIRLTVTDEGELKNIGFNPQMVGNDVWYMHSGTGDTVKFYPNDQAKVLFTSKSSSMKVPSFNTTIEKMLAWLPTKYNATLNVSPIKSGGSVTPATVQSLGGSLPPPPTPGVKAGAMFEKTFTDAGFVWDDMGGEYIDYPNKVPGEAHNSLKIAADRSSVLTFVDGTNINFKNLPSLVAYIKGDYQAQKKSSSLNLQSKTIKIYPSWMPPKMLELLEKGKYEYFGANNGTAYGYKNSAGDEILIYPTGKAQVKDSKTPGYSEPYDTLEEVIQYLQEKFGSVPTINIHLEKALHELGFVNTTQKGGTIEFVNGNTGDVFYYNKNGTATLLTKDTDGSSKTYPFKDIYAAINYLNGLLLAKNPISTSNAMTKEEEEEIEKLVAQYPNLKFTKGYLTEAKPSNKPQVQYVSITDINKGMPVFAITKRRGKYAMYKVIDNTWDKVYEDTSFIGMKSFIQSALIVHQGGPSTLKDELTEEEMEWIETFVKTKLPMDGAINVIPQVDNTIAIVDKNGDIFRVLKKANVYIIRYSTADANPTTQLKFNYASFNTFQELSNDLVQNLDVYTQVISTKPKRTVSGGSSSNNESINVKLPSSYNFTLKQAGFNLGKDQSQHDCYNHSHDFLFKLMWSNKTKKNSIRWSTETGTKEHTPADMTKFLEVLSKVTPEMTGDHLDKLFSDQATSRRDKIFDQALTTASKMNGIGGPDAIKNLHGTLEDMGFIWDSYGKMYVNFEIRQVVTIVPTAGSLDYGVFFIAADNTVQYQVTVDPMLLLTLIGLDGSIHKEKKTSKKVTEPSGETYKTHDDQSNASLIMLNDHDATVLMHAGFTLATGENTYYKNYQGSVLRFYDTGKAEFYDSENGDSLPFDSIPHALKFAVEKYIGTAPASTDPKAHQDRQLRELGFVKQTPDTMPGFFGNQVIGVYLNSNLNQIIQEVKGGYASLYSWDPSNVSAKIIIGDQTIESIMAYLITQKAVAASNTSSPFSNADYNIKPTDEELNSIQLNETDAELLKTIGFKWEPKSKWYAKTMNGTETPALKEAGKKSKKGKKTPKNTPIPQFQLPLDSDYEIITVWNSGNAFWAWVKTPDDIFKHKGAIDNKEGTIKSILEFVWHRWSGNEKLSPATKNKYDNAGLSPETTRDLSKLGFVWVKHAESYLKNAGTNEEEKLSVTDDGLELYYIDEHGEYKTFSSNHSQAVLNIIAATVYAKSKNRLHAVGYKDNADLIGPPPTTQENTKVYAEMFKHDSKELLQIFMNGNVKYGKLLSQGTLTTLLPYKMFDSLEAAANYLAPKSVATVFRKKASRKTEEYLKNISFIWDSNNQEYFNTNNYSLRIVFLSDGTVDYYSEGTHGSSVKYKTEAEFFSFAPFAKIKENYYKTLMRLVYQ